MFQHEKSATEEESAAEQKTSKKTLQEEKVFSKKKKKKNAAPKENGTQREEKTPKFLRPTHFYALRVKDPQLLATLGEDIKQRTLGISLGNHQILPSHKYHITLLVVHLKNAEEQRQAAYILQDAVKKAALAQPITLTWAPDYGNFRRQVLFLSPSKESASQSAALNAALMELCQSHGINIVDRPSYTPHLALCKPIRFSKWKKQQRLKSNRRKLSSGADGQDASVISKSSRPKGELPPVLFTPMAPCLAMQIETATETVNQVDLLSMEEEAEDYYPILCSYYFTTQELAIIDKRLNE